MTLIFSSKNRILFNIEKSNQLLKLDYSKRFTTLLHCKKLYKSPSTSYKAYLSKKVTSKAVTNQILKRIVHTNSGSYNFTRAMRFCYAKRKFVIPSCQAKLDTLSSTSKRSLYCVHFGYKSKICSPSCATPFFIKSDDLQRRTSACKAYISPICNAYADAVQASWLLTYERSLSSVRVARDGESLVQAPSSYEPYPSPKVMCTAKQSIQSFALSTRSSDAQPLLGSVGALRTRDTNLQQESLQERTSLRFVRKVSKAELRIQEERYWSRAKKNRFIIFIYNNLASLKEKVGAIKVFVPKIRIWGFAFSSSFLLISISSILQRQEQDRWFFTFSRSQTPGLYLTSEKSSWESFENITLKYLSRKKPVYGYSNCKNLVKKIDCYKDIWYLYFSEFWNQQSIKNYTAVFSASLQKEKKFLKSKKLNNSILNKDVSLGKKWIVEPWYQMHSQLPPRKEVVKKIEEKGYGNGLDFLNFKKEKKTLFKINEYKERVSLENDSIPSKMSCSTTFDCLSYTQNTHKFYPVQNKSSQLFSPKATSTRYHVQHKLLLKKNKKREIYRNASIISQNLPSSIYRKNRYIHGRNDILKNLFYEFDNFSIEPKDFALPSKDTESLHDFSISLIPLRLNFKDVNKTLKNKSLSFLQKQKENKKRVDFENESSESRCEKAIRLLTFSAKNGEKEIDASTFSFLQQEDFFKNSVDLATQHDESPSGYPLYQTNNQSSFIKTRDLRKYRLCAFSVQKLAVARGKVGVEKEGTPFFCKFLLCTPRDIKDKKVKCVTTAYANFKPILDKSGDKISNYLLSRRNSISNRLMSGYQRPEVKKFQVQANPFIRGVESVASYPKHSFVRKKICASYRSFTSLCLQLFVDVKPRFAYKSKICKAQTSFDQKKTKKGSDKENRVSLLSMNLEFLPLSISLPPAFPFYESFLKNLSKRSIKQIAELSFPNRSEKIQKTLSKHPNFINVKNEKAPFFKEKDIDLEVKGPVIKSIKALRKMPYRLLSLNEIKEVQPLFEQVSKKFRISPYNFTFKKSLFTDYNDYLSWQKDTPLAISIVPSIEEEEVVKNSWIASSAPFADKSSLPFTNNLEKKGKESDATKNKEALETKDEIKAKTRKLSLIHENDERSESETNEEPFSESSIPAFGLPLPMPEGNGLHERARHGDEEEKKKEITKFEWLQQIRESEQLVEKRKDFQKLAYPNQKALLTKDLQVRAGIIPRRLSCDRKVSFFGITNLFPKRLISQDQKEINSQILRDEQIQRVVSLQKKVKKKSNEELFKKSLDSDDSAFPNQTEENSKYDEMTLTFSNSSSPIDFSQEEKNQKLSKRSSNQEPFSSIRLAPRNQQKDNDILKAKFFILETPPELQISSTEKANSLNAQDLNLRAYPSKILKDERNVRAKILAREHPIYTPNRRLRLRAPESSLSSQNNNFQNRIDELNLNQSHRWWQKRRIASSLLGAPSKRYLVMPEITTQDWRKIIEWQLKTYLLEEEKRLVPLISEKDNLSVSEKQLILSTKLPLSSSNEKSTFSNFSDSTLLTPFAKNPVKTGVKAKDFFKIKKIAIYLPWTTLKKSLKKPFEWPITGLSYASSFQQYSVKNGYQKKVKNNGFTFGEIENQKRVVKKIFYNCDSDFVLQSFIKNKQTDSCFVASISPHFKTFPFLSNQRYSFFTSTKGIKADILPKSQRKLFLKQLHQNSVYKAFLFESPTKNSYLALHSLLLAFAAKQFFSELYKAVGKTLINKLKNSSLSLALLPLFFNATARRNQISSFNHIKKRLKDLVGNEDTISSLSEIVWYLRNSCRGRMIPRGVVLVETFSSESTEFLKAIGGEAKVPVIVQSLRALPFTQNHPQRHLEKILTFAQKQAPCILFLDDLDSIGQSRNLLLKNNYVPLNPRFTCKNSVANQRFVAQKSWNLTPMDQIGNTNKVTSYNSFNLLQENKNCTARFPFRNLQSGVGQGEKSKWKTGKNKRDTKIRFTSPCSHQRCMCYKFLQTRVGMHFGYKSSSCSPSTRQNFCVQSKASNDQYTYNCKKKSKSGTCPRSGNPYFVKKETRFTAESYAKSKKNSTDEPVFLEKSKCKRNFLNKSLKVETLTDASKACFKSKKNVNIDKAFFFSQASKNSSCNANRSFLKRHSFSLDKERLKTGNGIENLKLLETEKLIKQRRVDLMLRLLTVMDGISQLNGVLIVTSSKNPSSLDPALLRPGRFEKLINLKLPSKKKRILFLKAKTSKIGHINPMPWEYFGTQTQDMTGTEIASAINHSAFRAIIQSTVHTFSTLEHGISCVNGDGFLAYNSGVQLGSRNTTLQEPSISFSGFESGTHNLLSVEETQKGQILQNTGASPKQDSEKFPLFLKQLIIHNPYKTFSVLSFSATEFWNNKRYRKKIRELSFQTAFSQAGTCLLQLQSNKKDSHFSPITLSSNKERRSAYAQNIRCKASHGLPLSPLKPLEYKSSIWCPYCAPFAEGLQSFTRRFVRKPIEKGYNNIFSRPSPSVKASFNGVTSYKSSCNTFSDAKPTISKNEAFGKMYTKEDFSLKRTDFAQDIICLYAGQASLLLYLNSIACFKKKIFNSSLRSSVCDRKKIKALHYPLKKIKVGSVANSFFQENKSQYKQHFITNKFSLANDLNNYSTCKSKHFCTEKKQLCFLQSSFCSKERLDAFNILQSTTANFFKDSSWSGWNNYPYLRKYLQFKPDSPVLFYDKMNKNFWWEKKISESLELFKRPSGNWYRLYLPKIEQNKNNREWLLSDQFCNQHISFLKQDVMIQNLIRHNIKNCVFAHALHARTYKSSICNAVHFRYKSLICSPSRVTHAVQPSWLLTYKRSLYSVRLSLWPTAITCTVARDQDSTDFSYYNMLLSCFYVAFQNCAENRELLDFLADHLIRFKFLKLHEMIRIALFY